MMIEVDDDFTDEITAANLADSYASISKNLKNCVSWHPDDIKGWQELLPALMIVGKWYSVNFEADIRKAAKKK